MSAFDALLGTKTTTTKKKQTSAFDTLLAEPKPVAPMAGPVYKPWLNEAATHAYNPLNPNNRINEPLPTTSVTKNLITTLDKKIASPALEATSNVLGKVFQGIGAGAKTVEKVLQVPANLITGKGKKSYSSAQTIGQSTQTFTDILLAGEAQKAEQRLIANNGAGFVDSLIAAYPQITKQLVDDLLIPAGISAALGGELMTQQKSLKVTPEQIDAALKNPNLQWSPEARVNLEVAKAKGGFEIKGTSPSGNIVRQTVGQLLGGQAKSGGKISPLGESTTLPAKIGFAEASKLPPATLASYVPQVEGNKIVYTAKTAPIEAIRGKYLYHGTADINLESVAKDGLKPMGRGLTSLSKDEAYARSYAESSRFPRKEGQGVVLRVNAEYVKGETVAGKPNRPLSDQMHEILTKKTIPPEAIEIFKNGKWQPLKENPLLAEAKKYKSADEFVKAQTQVFRGGDSAIDTTRGGKQGISVTTDKNIAENFVGPDSGVVGDAHLSPNAKILKEADIPSKLQSAYMTEAEKLSNINNFSPALQKSVLAKQQAIIEYARKNGFDAVDFPFEQEIRIIKPNVLKTQSQLTDIYNKAKGETVKPEGKVTKAASDINTELVSKGFENLPEDVLAKFDPITKKATVEKVAEFMNTNLETAKKAAITGEVPNNIHKQVLFNAMEEYATNKGDVKLLTDLAGSPIATERSIAAQTLGASGFNKNPNSFVAKLQEINKARAEKSATRTKSVATSLKKATQVKLTPEQKSISKFLDELAC